MRFSEGGPDLPDDLLNARDEGQVVFFCGAGVSRAKAKLPNFLKLARDVVDGLGSAEDSPARRLLQTTEAQGQIAGVGGLIPTDRIFGLLEREFPVADVRGAVARALRPDRSADLSAHRTLIDLARGPDGRLRLVTTNFDRLFEACDSTIRVSGPGTLPDPRRLKLFEGVIHLHGLVTKAYDGAQDDEFVLSSADFGRAYLSDGWATSFIRALLERFQLVFVGYAADDPPVRYLLEALNNGASELAGLYAFQEGKQDEADSLWRHRGVQAISYDPANEHSALWTTLDEWGTRARSPSQWRDTVLELSLAGPQSLSPVQRGQVKHIVSNTAGAKAFSAARPPIEWLCVLDPLIRYATPQRVSDERVGFDPFEAYGLDDDPPPQPPNPDESYAERLRPIGTWDAFEPTSRERTRVDVDHLASLRGLRSPSAPRLSTRLYHIGSWIAELACHPLAAWWAAGQGGLHPDIQQAVRSSIGRRDCPPVVVAAWGLIFKTWEKTGTVPSEYEIWARVSREGWSIDIVRALADLHLGRLKVTRPSSGEPPPFQEDVSDLDKIISTSVDFADLHQVDQIPDEFLGVYATELRRNLEISADLQKSIYGRCGFNLPPIERDPISGLDDHVYGLARPLMHFAQVLERFRVHDRSSWTAEIKSWTSKSVPIQRLKLWIAGRPDGLSSADAAKFILGTDDETFWSVEAQRDLLISISRRWPDSSLRAKHAIEQRLLRGPPRWRREEAAKFRSRRANHILNRIYWLSANGATPTRDLTEVLGELRRSAPGWRESFGAQAARSLESRAGSVSVDPSTQGLEAVGPATLLREAAAGTTHEFEDFVERRPLAGLSMSRPVSVLRALVLSTRRGEFPEWAWDTFLSSDQRPADRTRLLRAIALRLSELPPEAIASLAYQVADWVNRTATRLAVECPTALTQLWGALMVALLKHPEATHPATARKGGIDWPGHSLNAPVGKLAQAALSANVAVSPKKPTPELLYRLAALLALEGDSRCDALAIIGHRLRWLFYYQPAWTEERVLSVLDDPTSEEARALWSGVFWAGQAPQPRLFVRLKEHLLNLIETNYFNLSADDNLPAFILIGWAFAKLSRKQVISDKEMRSSLLRGGDRFRVRVISHLERWSNDPSGDWKSKTLTLFRKVWPRQISARTQRVSEQLVEFALAADGWFETAAEAAIPYIVPISSSSFVLHRLADEINLSKVEPRTLLRLLALALPQRASDWPYGAEAVVNRLSAVAELMSDPNLLDLRLRLARPD